VKAESDADYEEFLAQKRSEAVERKRINRQRALQGLPPATDQEFYEQWMKEMDERENQLIYNQFLDENGYPIPLPEGESEYITQKEFKLQEEWYDTIPRKNYGYTPI